MTEPRSLGELMSKTPDCRIAGNAACLVSGISFDSRAVEPGDLFVALRGGYTDGHNYLAAAVARGASALLVEEPIDVDLPVALVCDSRAALADVSACFYQYPSRELGVVGITGTDGKTSTSVLAEAMLARAGKRTGLIGTVSVKIGDDVVDHETRQTTPESLEIQRMLRRMVDERVDWVVLEATSHGLDMHRLDHIEFDIAAVTNITHEHLDFHGSIEAYWRAKARLFERLNPERGIAIVNADDPGALSVVPYCDGRPVMQYGIDRDDVDVAAHDISLKIHGASFQLHGTFGERSVRTPLLGRFNVSNALCATGIALAAGVDIDTIVETLAAPPDISGRMASVNAGQPFGVVVDYAHTPASLEKVLTLLRTFPGQRRLIVVSGSAGERDIAKRSIQGSVCARLADVSIFSNEDPRNESAEEIIGQIAAGARAEGAIDGENLFEIVDRREAVFHAISMAKPGDTVLLAGKGHERSIIWNGIKHPWNETDVAYEALASLGYEKDRNI